MHYITEYMKNVREKKPLVHHITNYVTVNDCANITICAGGSPVMTDAKKDVVDMVSISSAVVLNIGTLNPETVESMIIAGQEANDKGIPVVFDPVGVGATKYRTDVAQSIMNKVKISVIKGNSGEIGVLSNTGGKVRGVDSVTDLENSMDSVRKLFNETGAIIAMTGETDYVCDSKTIFKLNNGHEYLECVSGTGCMVASVIGCYVAANEVTAESVASAISVFSIAGEIAAVDTKGPGSFKPKIFDALYNLTSDEVSSRIKLKEHVF